MSTCAESLHGTRGVAKWRGAAYFTKGSGFEWHSDVGMDAPEVETAKHLPEFVAVPFQTYQVKAGECLYIRLIALATCSVE